MPPATAPTYVYCTSADVDFLLSADGTTGRVDDDESGTQSAGEAAFVTQAIRWATATCNLYLSAYPQADLANSWLVNQWCTLIAAHTISARRGNSATDTLAGLRDQAIEDMKMVRSGQYVLADVALREGAWPRWSNVSYSDIHRLRKIRVERPISESRSGGVDYNQSVDRPADHIGNYENY